MKHNLRLGIISLGTVAAALATLALLAVSPCRAAELQTIHYRLPAAITNSTPVARAPQWKPLNLALGLPLRHQEELNALLGQINDPSSPNFHHYLTPQQFTERFGPSEEDYAKLIAFAKAHHLRVTGTHPNRMLLDVRGLTRDIERTFNVKLHLYRHPTEARNFFAPDTEPSIDLDVPVLTVSGLDNYLVPRPMNLKKQDAASPQAGTGSGPSGAFLGYDFRAAYVPGVALNGAGQTVGLLEFDSGYYQSDITQYEELAGLPNVPVQPVLLDGYTGGAGDGNDEVSLDIEMAIAMAPGLDEVLVYEGSLTDDILNRMATDNLAKQIGASWTYGIDATSQQIWNEMILQGQSFYNASGDSDAYTGTIPTPCDNTNIICVGGTTLTTSGPQGSWVSETVWNWGVEYGAADAGIGSSGGISTVWNIPPWQEGIDMTANQGSTTLRNLPDVALTADNIWVIYGNGESGSFGGTSCATPLWAAFTALANQLALTNGQATVGFINPAIYAMGKGSNVFSYSTLFHDIVTGNNESPSSPTKFTAVPGYDLCTGWGTPQGSNLLLALAVPEPLRITPLGGLVLSGPVGGPFNSAVFSLTNGSLGSLTWSLLNTSVWFTLSPTSGVLTRGGPATLVQVGLTATASNLVPGSYTATIQFSNQASHFVQTRLATFAVVTPPLITSQPTNQPVLWGAPASFAVGTGPDALLYYQWQANGTNLSDGGHIAGSLTSTLTINNASPGNVGNYSVIISNAAGVQVSSNALLSIVPSVPVVVSPPTNQTVLPGAPAAFSVAAVGNHPFSYQWQLNGTNVAHATNSTLSLAAAWSTNLGAYSVIISNNLGATRSAGALLALIPVTVPGLTLSSLYSFPASDLSGDTPYAPLVKGRDGKLYGTTEEGGTNSYGTIFRVATNGAFNTLFSFNFTDGGIIYGGLVQGSDANLYGMGSEGGVDGDGTVFRLATNGGSFSTLLNFNGNNGEFPVAGLVQGTDGSLYGTTLEGGVYDYGTVFKITTNGTRTALLAFSYGDGADPSGVLVQGPDGNFYGTTEEGGQYGYGTVFKITSAGALTTLYDFTGGDDGAFPIPGLTLANDGNYYGTTLEGGTNIDYGTVFRITSQGALTSLYSFGGANDGAYPWAGLVQSSDGNLYGATEEDGAYSGGTVFRITEGGEFAVVASFDGYEGSTPLAALTQGADGNLYSTTSAGGVGSYGTVFQLKTAGPLQITAQPQDQSVYLGGTAMFTVATFGGLPVTYQWQEDGTNLVNGNGISGVTTDVLIITNAGIANVALYSVIVSNAFGALSSDQAFLDVTFSPPQITSQPAALNLLQGQTAVFSVQAVGDLPLSYQWRFNGTNLSDGGQVTGSASNTLVITSVAAANAGSYSVTIRNPIAAVASGGASLTVSPISPPGVALSVPHLFTDGSDGAFPYASLIQARDGNLYGTASSGGSDFDGEIFRLSLGGTLSALYPFSGGTDGSEPYAALVQASSGYLFGATLYGGSDDFGTLFRTAPGSTTIEAVYSFTDGNDGAYPYAALVQAADGNLYGTAYEGGTNGLGTVYKVTTNYLVTPLYSFTGGNDGEYPYASLVQAVNGNLYGTATEGGPLGYGTVFGMTPKGVLTMTVPFNYTNGAYPEAGLVQSPDGSLYGTTEDGGAYGFGTVFRVSTNGTLAVVVAFNYTNGAYPIAGLTLGSDGNLYGAAAEGGPGGFGTAFRLTTNGTLTTLAVFDGLDGAYPEAALVQANNGKFYGTTAYGGTGFSGTANSGQGTIFELTVPIFNSSSVTLPSITAGVPYSANISADASSVPGDTLTFALLSGPAWVSVAANGLVSGTPTTNNLGTNAFVATLTDTNGSTASATFVIKVVSAVAPTFAANPITFPAINEGQAESNSIANYAVNNNPGDSNFFALVSGPAWLSVATNGALSGTPPLANVGTNTFVISVTDLLGLSNSATIYIPVLGPPEFASNPFNGPYAGVGVAMPVTNSIANSASDPNPGNTLAYGLVSGPAWLSISNNGVLSGTPATNNAGTNVFVVSATDSGGLSVQATMFIYVYTPPSFIQHPFNGPVAIVGIPYQGTIATNAAPDPDAVIGDMLSFGLTLGPSWLNVAPSGQLSGIPSAADVGTELFHVLVRDSAGYLGTAQMHITVNTDSPPFFLLSPFSLPDAKAGLPYAGTVATNATSPNLQYGDTITFLKVSGPAWLNVSSNGILSGTPGLGDGGTNTFVLGVVDYAGLSNNATLVLNVEGAPAFTSNLLTLPWASQDQSYTVSLATNTIEPVAGTTVLIGKVSGPAWLNVSTNGVVSGTPVLGNAGSNIFVVNITDYRGLTNTATLGVFVTSPIFFSPSEFSEPPATAGVPYRGSLFTNVVNPNAIAGDTLSFFKVTGPAWLSVATNGALTGIPANTDIGAGSCLVLCLDEAGWAAAGTMNVQVLAAPIQLGISHGSNLLTLSWTGGSPPYQVQTTTNLLGGAWSSLGSPMSTNVISLPLSNPAAWFRIQGQ